MDGDPEMTGAPTPIKIEGEIYLLGPLTVTDAAIIKQAILNARKRPEDILPAILPKFEKEQQRTILEVAYLDWLYGPRVSESEVDDFIKTKHGGMLQAYLLLRHNHPDITAEEVNRLWGLEVEAFGRVLQESWQPVGNSSAPDGAGAAQASTSPGEESTVG